MKRALLVIGALLLGLGAGEILRTNFAFRAALGRAAGRGELLALVGSRGLYDRDLESIGRPLGSLVDQARLNLAAHGTAVSDDAIAHEMSLLRAAFPSENAWTVALARAGTSASALRREVTENLRGRAWLESQVHVAASPNDAELRAVFEREHGELAEPLRFRANHLFLAAPVGCPTSLYEEKRALIDSLAARLGEGEDFAALTAEFSEDEATKALEGDLNYFAEARMLPEVWRALGTLRAGESSRPVRSRLGFHLLRLTNRAEARPRSLAEASPEIGARLENAARAQAVARLRSALPGKIQFASSRK